MTRVILIVFHISFIIYDLDEQELLLTSTQDINFKKFGAGTDFWQIFKPRQAHA